MERIGFSTGALAKGDLRRGVELQSFLEGDVIELSALRESELDGFFAALDHLRLDRYTYISVHAPSRLTDMDERTLCDRLLALPSAWPIVVHPDLITSAAAWKPLGSRLCIENMDRRKRTGQRADDLEPLMTSLPEAGFCLDLAHAAEVDPTMNEAKLLLGRFGERLGQVHVSRLGPASEHLPLDTEMIDRIRQIAPEIPRTVPLIIESVVEADELEREVARVAEAFGR